MKFYFFTKGDKNIPSSRYRAFYIAEVLNTSGYEAVVIPAIDHSIKGFFKYLKILLKIRSNDVIYLQRTIYNKYFLLALLIARISGRHFIFDIDDAVYEHSELKTRLLTKYADFVTCGSEKIKQWTDQYNKNSYILTNSIPLSVYTERLDEPDGIPVIGWIGTMPERFIIPAIPALEKLASCGINFNLKIIGAMGNPKIKNLLRNMPNVTVIDSLNWSDPSEAVTEIKTFTVGIMPLTSSEWDQVKYFKALEYMACNVPVVATAGSAVRKIIEEAGCGFVVSNTTEWVEKISLLINDKSLRVEMGTKGRLAIESSYSVNASVTELLSLVEINNSFKK